MNRRKFFKAGGAFGAGTLLMPGTLLASQHQVNDWAAPMKKAKNIIFMVSDGMSMGTLTMAEIFNKRKNGYSTHWMDIYNKTHVKRALMDTSSASALVTDSAAGGSAWGSGVKVPNGKLNMGANGEVYQPLLQKFKKAGKAVGCVTSVPITHATPASFCVNKKHRSLQDEIAADYLDLRFDLMMGSGSEHFSADKRADGRDLFSAFKSAGYFVAHQKSDLNSAPKNLPVLGVFGEGALPYAIDQQTEKEQHIAMPTLAEMTDFAIDKLSQNTEGFVLQIEGGKVDWAAHANDTTAIIHDQLAFDEAVGIALQFAANREDTLVVITTDHGNANPGLFYGKKSDANFEQLFEAKHSNEWVLKQVSTSTKPHQLIDLLHHATNLRISDDEATALLKKVKDLPSDGLYNPYKLPFGELAAIQANYSSVYWAYDNHSADHVELVMFGAASELLPPFIQNNALHHLLLHQAAVSI